LGGCLTLCLLSPASLQAATIWTNWTTATTGGPGSATGTNGSVTVTYSGELDGAITNGGSSVWAPNSSFTGGTVTTSPSVVGDELALNGSYTGTNTISFSSPVTDPLIAIWSLGQPGLSASFNFIGITPTLEAGGPNSQYGGSSITVLANSVFGNEGNGVVQFTGTFSSLSWTNTFENYYSFTVGVNGSDTPAPVPEPMTMTLVGSGVVGMLLRRRRA
jgi:hypothetical protein